MLYSNFWREKKISLIFYIAIDEGRFCNKNHSGMECVQINI